MPEFSAGQTSRLVRAIRDLSHARTNEQVQAVVRSAARELLAADGATFVLRDGPCCYYVDEEAIAPLWKGLRFPLEQCISGWAMLNKQHAVIPDVLVDERIPQDAYRRTFVRSLVMVPIRRPDPIGAIGVYWAGRHEAGPGEVELIQSLADSTSVALENVAIGQQLEQRIQERTAQLHEANRALAEVAARDPLTGLLNRRGFYAAAERRLSDARAADRTALLAFLDMDRLKAINDECGHEVGSAAIAETAAAIQECFRETDLVGRIGGDEFAVLVVDPPDEATFARRLATEFDRHNRQPDRAYRLSASMGIVTRVGTESLHALLAAADQAMYREKRAGRAA